MADIPEAWRQNFEELGPRKVEHIMRGGGFGDRAAAALDWLQEMDREKEAASRLREEMRDRWMKAATVAAILAAIFAAIPLLPDSQNASPAKSSGSVAARRQPHYSASKPTDRPRVILHR
jgi:hypothetical protein